MEFLSPEWRRASLSDKIHHALSHRQSQDPIILFADLSVRQPQERESARADDTAAAAAVSDVAPQRTFHECPSGGGVGDTFPCRAVLTAGALRRLSRELDAAVTKAAQREAQGAGVTEERQQQGTPLPQREQNGGASNSRCRLTNHCRHPRCDVGLVCLETFWSSVAEAACLVAGRSFCVFNPCDPPLRRERLISQRAPRILLVEEDIVRMWEVAAGQRSAQEERVPRADEPTTNGVAAAEEGEEEGEEAVPRRESNEGEGITSVLHSTPTTVLPHSDTVSDQSSTAVNEAIHSEDDEDAVAYYMYTSGSTGVPKCVVATRRNLNAYVTHFAFSACAAEVVAGDATQDNITREGRPPSCTAVEGMGATRDTSLLTLSTPFFDPSIGDVIVALLAPQGRQTCVPRAALSDGGLAAYLALVRPTHVVTTPAVWGSLPPPPARPGRDTDGGSSHDRVEGRATHRPLSYDGKNAASLQTTPPAMRVFLGGERMTQACVDAWAGAVSLHNIYGVTEATIYQSCCAVPAGARVTDIHCGSGGRGAQVLILPIEATEGDDDAKAAPALAAVFGGGGAAAAVGEVALRGPQVCAYADSGEEESENDGDSESPNAGTDATACASGSEGPFYVDAATGERVFRTGDIGWLQQQQPQQLPPSLTPAPPVLRLAGRADWQVKISGQRVALEEVQQTLCACLAAALAPNAGVACCVCCCRPPQPDGGTAAAAPPIIGCGVALRDDAGGGIKRGGRGLAALAEAPHESGEEGAAAWARFVTAALEAVAARALPAHMVPRLWWLCPRGAALPLTATGKADRRALAALLESRLDAPRQEQEQERQDHHGGGDTRQKGAQDVSSGDRLTEMVLRVWQSRLPGPRVGLDTHFARRGGDSLGALRITRAVYAELCRASSSVSAGGDGDGGGGSNAGVDAGVDEWGGMPPALHPRLLLAHPVLRDYVAALRAALAAPHPPPPGVSAELLAELTRADAAKTTENSSKADGDSGEERAMTGDELLLQAAAAGATGVAAALIACGAADVNAHNDRQNRCATPLHVAVNPPVDKSPDSHDEEEEERTCAMVAMLLAAGARPTAVTADLVTPAHLAAGRATPRVLELLLAPKTTDSAVSAPVSSLPSVLLRCRDGRQQSLLHFAARAGSGRMADWLLARYSPAAELLAMRDKWQRTAAHWAVLNGHLACLRVLARWAAAAAAADTSSASGGSGPNRDHTPGDGANTAEGADSAGEVEKPLKEKGKPRRGGGEARYARLARKHTHLPYESVAALACRLHGEDSDMHAVAVSISAVIDT